MESLARFSAGSVSGKKNTATKSVALRVVISQNMALHDQMSCKKPPARGAMMGASARIVINADSILAASVRLYKSRTIERESIRPMQAPVA